MAGPVAAFVGQALAGVGVSGRVLGRQGGRQCYGAAGGKAVVEGERPEDQLSVEQRLRYLGEYLRALCAERFEVIAEQRL
jgi:hypothetical protein